MKKLSMLLIYMIILTACSTSQDIKANEEVAKQKAEVVEEVNKDEQVQSGNDLNQWYGKWIGVNSTYYTGSELNIEPVSDNSIEFELAAFNGCHIGNYEDTANIENGKAVLKTEDEIEFIFSLDEKGRIQLQCSDYTYYCGSGVEFDSVYVKDINIKLPTAVEVGLVDNSEQEKIFKTLTGDMYDCFIDYAQYYLDEDNCYKNYRIRSFGLLGYSNAAVVMLNNEKNNIIAVIDSGEGVNYYTNDDNYKENPPEYIDKWLNGRKIVNMESIK